MADISKSIAKLRSKYGQAIMFRGDDDALPNIETVSSGSYDLDAALGGGFARGRIIELYGKNSSGKTSYAYMTIAQFQKTSDKPVLFVDTENTANLEYAAQLGVNLDEMWLAQPETAQEALNLISDSLDEEIFSLIVLDSVAALTPKEEIDGEIEDAKVALVARLMSKHMRVVNTKLNNTTLLYINQLRKNIGFVSGNVTTGGEALAYYATQRVEIIRIAWLKKGEEIIGNDLKVVVIKNKIAPPRKIVRSEFIYGKGIQLEREVLLACVKNKILAKEGAWIKDKSDPENIITIGNGKNKSTEFLVDNPEYFEKLLAKLKAI